MTTLEAGDAFGESSVKTDGAKRQHTVFCETDVHLFRFDKTDFQRLIKTDRDVRQHTLGSFLAGTPLLCGMSAELRKHAADHLSMRSFRAGERIVAEGAISDWLYLVFRGTCKAVQEVRLHVDDLSARERRAYNEAGPADRRAMLRRSLKLAELGPGDHLGCKAVANGCKTEFSVIAVSDEVEIAALQKFDAQHCPANVAGAVELPVLPPEAARREFLMRREKHAWQRYKEGLMESLFE